MARLPVLLLAAALALVAGCGQPPPSQGGGAETPELRTAREGDGGVVGTINGTSCVGALHLAYLPSSLVDPELPAGYSSGYVGQGGVAQASLMVYECAAVTVGNVTEAGVRLADASVWLVNGDGYRWEVFVDEPEPRAVAALLQSAGWSVLPAQIAATPLGYDVKSDGGAGIDYALTIGPKQVGHEPFDGSWPTLLHHVTPDGRHLRLTEDIATGTQVLYATTLEAHGGVWGRIADRLGGAPVPGTAQDVDSARLVLEAMAPVGPGTTP